MRELRIHNHQRGCRLQPGQLRRLTLHLLHHQLQLPHYALGLHLVNSTRITQLNEQFLRHAGPTDVIAFDYRQPNDPLPLHGEIFICTDEARRQARHYQTTWHEELARYLIHGLLHLLGHDDQETHAQRLMKSQENSLLRDLQRHHPSRRLASRLSP